MHMRKTFCAIMGKVDQEMKKASIVDVAKMAGVSIATVSNVCTGNKYVSKELEQSVLDAIEKLNYKPNYMASSLRSQKSKMIAVMIPSYAMEYYGEMLQGIQDVAASRGCVITTFETKSMIEREIDYLYIASELMVSGVIILSQAMDCDEDSNKRYSRALTELTTREGRIPVISVMRRTGVDTVDELLLDNVHSSADAVKYLISLGHTKIGTITGGTDSVIARDRCEGYKKALTEAGIPIDENRIVNMPDYSAKSGFYGMQKLLKETDVTAVFTGNDKLAMGAMKGAAAMGKKVPEDVSVIGFDGVSTCELVTPALSTVDVSSYEVGRMAMDRLFKRMANEDLPYEPQVIRSPVVARQSTSLLKGI